MMMPTRETVVAWPLLLFLFSSSLLLIIPSSVLSVSASNTHYKSPIAFPGCQDRCGDIAIPYPFGIGLNCSFNSWFNISCNSTLQPPILESLIWKYPFDEPDQAIEISGIELNLSTNDFPTSTLAIYGSYNWYNFDDSKLSVMQSLDMVGSPFALMGTRNVLVVKGCGGSVVLKNNTHNDTVVGCSTVCSHHVNPSITGYLSCNGIGCSQASVPISLDYFRIEFLTAPNDVWDGIEAAVFDTSFIAGKTINYSFSVTETSTPASRLFCSGGFRICRSIPRNTLIPGVGCIPICRRDTRVNADQCLMPAIHIYLPNGCQGKLLDMLLVIQLRAVAYSIQPINLLKKQDVEMMLMDVTVIKECEKCVETCVKAAIEDNSTMYSYPQKASKPVALAVICSGLGLALSVICCHWLYHFIKKRRKTEQRVKLFKLMLQQNGVAAERTKVFTHKELDKATDHFNENRILGQGGQGTVYKGMLIDGMIVAIKRSKLMDESQMEPFINELVILAQINHRNVVALLGCCLEKEVPLLVYEFVPNGTLSHHIHNPNEDFSLSWVLRLKIAIDSAGAIAYLHSSSSTPIYHRDIKSSNILLDDKYKAKVSDFGTSKSIGIDQTHLTTLVRGTMGYLDPEYFQSNQFIDKSDVYSFEVVLLELLTGKKPIYRDETMEQKNLVTEFLYLMRNSRLSDILDPEVVNGAKEEELIVITHLAKRCLNGSGRLRPTMKEVAMTLEMIIKAPTQMSMQDQQDLPYEEFDESVMAEITDSDFMSNPPPTSAGSPLYIDVQPLLHKTL